MSWTLLEVVKVGCHLPLSADFQSQSCNSGENPGAIVMIDLLIKDLDKEMTKAENEEKETQADTFDTFDIEKVSRKVII